MKIDVVHMMGLHCFDAVVCVEFRETIEETIRFSTFCASVLTSWNGLEGP
jgi:hypothetical protein